MHPLVSPVMPFFAILELFLLLFIPCIQESRKLFDCNEHILRAQYRGGRAISCIFQKADLRPRERKSHGSDRTRGSEKKGFLYREKVHIFFPDRRVWNGTFSGHQSLNLLM